MLNDHVKLWGPVGPADQTLKEASVAESSEQPEEQREVPEEVRQAAKLIEHEVTDEDPGVIILYNEGGLASHAPFAGLSTAAACKQAIATVATTCGMEQADDRLSLASVAVFWGSQHAFCTTLNRLLRTGWLRRRAGMADVGDLWVITPSGAARPLGFEELDAPFHC